MRPGCIDTVKGSGTLFVVPSWLLMCDTPFSISAQKSLGRCHTSIDFFSLARDSALFRFALRDPHVRICFQSSFSLLQKQHGLSS
jgi:hypothetical protein